MKNDSRTQIGTKITYFLKTNKETLIPLSIGFAAFCLVAIIFSLYAIFSDDGDLKNFFISISASFIEDAIFFFLVGIVVTWISFRDPSRAGFEFRTRWLFNSSKVDERLLDHVKEKAASLAIYSHEHVITITFDSFNENKSAIKTFINSKRKFSNLIADAAPKFFQHRYHAYPDIIYEEGNNGELTSAWKIIGPEGSPRERVIRSPIRLPNSGIVEVVNIDIAKNGQAEFEHDFWVWYKIGESFFYIIEQYTERMSVIVENKLESVIMLESDNGTTKNEFLLTKNDSRIFQKNSVEPSRQEPFRLKEVK